MILLLQNEVGLREQLNGVFNDYLSDAFSNVGYLMTIGSSFAYIGVGLIALKVFLDKNQRVNIFSYLKWLPLAFIFINYKYFASSIFEFYEMIGRSLESNDITWDTIFQKISDAQEARLAEFGDIGFFDIFRPSVLEVIITAQICNFFVYIGMAISTIAFIGIKSMSVIYLYVLIVFGPLNIGLSFIPALSGMWKTWLQKFMSVCLWIPMVYLIDNFLLGIMDAVITSLFVDDSANFGIILTGCLLILMNTFIYLKAPTLSNFIVQGMSVSGSSIKDSPKHYGKKAGKAAINAKSGGLAKGAETLMQ